MSQVAAVRQAIPVRAQKRHDIYKLTAAADKK